MDTPQLKITGPAADLEARFILHGDKPLPDPRGSIPFTKMGEQIIMPQPRVQQPEVKQMVVSTTSNRLPFTHGRFFGVPVAQETKVRQINQPGFLSVNEEIYA